MHPTSSWMNNPRRPWKWDALSLEVRWFICGKTDQFKPAQERLIWNIINPTIRWVSLGSSPNHPVTPVISIMHSWSLAWRHSKNYIDFYTDNLQEKDLLQTIRNKLKYRCCYNIWGGESCRARHAKARELSVMWHVRLEMRKERTIG